MRGASEGERCGFGEDLGERVCEDGVCDVGFGMRWLVTEMAVGLEVMMAVVMVVVEVNGGRKRECCCGHGSEREDRRSGDWFFVFYYLWINIYMVSHLALCSC